MICSHCGFDDEGLNPFSKCLGCGLPFGTTVTDDLSTLSVDAGVGSRNHE
ncbi:MAG: hypothetical protein IKD00_00640 [Candidatus Methanomethylophilaceae archaeon]|nr:hypothetical protein [Candidatus Methanomethylophilaceae archaeon]